MKALPRGFLIRVALTVFPTATLLRNLLAASYTALASRISDSRRRIRYVYAVLAALATLVSPCAHHQVVQFKVDPDDVQMLLFILVVLIAVADAACHTPGSKRYSTLQPKQVVIH